MSGQVLRDWWCGMAVAEVQVAAVARRAARKSVRIVARWDCDLDVV